MAPNESPDRSPGPGIGSAVEMAKRALRDQHQTARGRLSVADLGARARALAELLVETPEVRRAATVAAYVSVGREPGTGPLLDQLADRGVRVLLPRLLPDFDLDWAVHDGRLHSARLGLLEPSGPSLGADAVAEADVVLVPGLAVDHHGMRMGRGGGSYDRVLARLPRDAWTCVLLNEAEVVEAVPREAHDQAVRAAATEVGLLRF